MVTEVERLPWEDEDKMIEVPEVEGEIVSEVALIPAAPPTHHVIVGLGTLAAMSEEDYQARKGELQTGMARLRDLVESILVKGEDYGHVQGIDKPFLHQPGAEKLSNFFGLAVRQEAERVEGRKAMVRIGDVEQESGEWLSPPFAYHVKSFVHLGDFSGPVVAQGFGEASCWEDKYRYRWQNPTCPSCNREGLIKRKSPPNLAGKWNCPSWQNKGGCNAVFEPNDERIGAAAKVEYENPYSNAETILLMAAKRSLVSSIRRATGTSGLFTQDEDAPSVRAQAGDAFGDDGEAPKIENVPSIVAAAGGKEALASTAQLRELVALSQEKDLGAPGISALLKRLFGKTVGETQKAVSDAAKALTGDEIGQLLVAIRTGEVPEVTETTVIEVEPFAGNHAVFVSPDGTVHDPVADDFLAEPAKPRRGRPPGSKNRPKEPETFEADA
jgi:hypothetical protein